MKTALELIKEVRTEKEGEIENRARGIIRCYLKEIEAAEKAVELSTAALKKLREQHSEMIEMDVADIVKNHGNHIISGMEFLDSVAVPTSGRWTARQNR